MKFVASSIMTSFGPEQLGHHVGLAGLGPAVCYMYIIL